MKSVFKKSVIAGAMVIGLMVSPMSAGTALAAEDGAGVTVAGVTPYFDPTDPYDPGGPGWKGPFGSQSSCQVSSYISNTILGHSILACQQRPDGSWWFYEF